MNDTAVGGAIAELADTLPAAASHIIRDALLGPKAGDLHLGDARVTLQLVLATAEAKGMDVGRMAWPSLAAAIALLAARDADRLEARARCGFSHRELYWSLQSDMYGFHTGGVTGARRFGRCLPCAIGKPGKCGASSAAWFCRRRLSLLDTRDLAPRTKTAALLMDGVTLLPSRSAGHILARGLDGSGQPQGPSRKTVGPPPGPQDDDRVSLFDRNTWSGERLGGVVALVDDKPETFVAQARTLLDSLQGMTPEQQWRQVSHACTKRYVGCLKRLAGKESRKRKQAHKGAGPPPLVEAELAATELRRWPDYAFLMMADETDDCLPQADVETSLCFLNNSSRAAAAEMQPAAFGMPAWHLRPDLPGPRCLADSPRAPLSRRSSGALRRRGSAEARLQRPPPERPVAVSPALSSGADSSAALGGTAAAGSHIGGPAALPLFCGPQAAYQHCNSFFARGLPGDDGACWAPPQGGFGVTLPGALQSAGWGTGLRGTQSADYPTLAPAQLQMPLPHPLPSHGSAPISLHRSSGSQLSSSGRLCSSGVPACTEKRPCGGCFSVRTRSNPECVATHITLATAKDALPPRSYSLSTPLEHPAAQLLHEDAQHGVLPQTGGWRHFQAAFADANGASRQGHCRDSCSVAGSGAEHNGLATLKTEPWDTGAQLPTGQDMQLSAFSTMPQEATLCLPQHCWPGVQHVEQLTAHGNDGPRSSGQAQDVIIVEATQVAAARQHAWPPHSNMMQAGHHAQQAADGPNPPQPLQIQLTADHISVTAPTNGSAALQHPQQQQQQQQQLQGQLSQETELAPEADRHDSLASLLRQSSLGQLFRQESLAAMGSCSVGSDCLPQSLAMGTAAPPPSPAVGDLPLGPLPAAAAGQAWDGELRSIITGSAPGRALSRPPSLQRGGSSTSLNGWRSTDWDAVVLEALEGNMMEDFLHPASSM